MLHFVNKSKPKYKYNALQEAISHFISGTKSYQYKFSPEFYFDALKKITLFMTMDSDWGNLNDRNIVCTELRRILNRIDFLDERSIIGSKIAHSSQFKGYNVNPNALCQKYKEQILSCIERIYPEEEETKIVVAAKSLRVLR